MVQPVIGQFDHAPVQMVDPEAGQFGKAPAQMVQPEAGERDGEPRQTTRSPGAVEGAGFAGDVTTGQQGRWSRAVRTEREDASGWDGIWQG
ncbi:hypothetical protein, partial [Microtetraspora sp. NBRC 16547]|uniref:hypothetical protein n=1 Tax=Microtetraspora sp. NBRC 16547 TaxID=3030993 RepID=UPI002555A9C0